MLEWVPIIGSIVKAVGALRKEAKDIGADVNEQIDKKVGARPWWTLRACALNLPG